MTRRLHPCATCSPTEVALIDPAGTRRDLNPFLIPRGLTRHADRRCSRCRRHGPPPPTVTYRGRAA